MKWHRLAMVLMTVMLGASLAAAQDPPTERMRVEGRQWMKVHETNRSPQSVCSFQAFQVILSLDEAAPELLQAANSNEKIGKVEIEFPRRTGTPYYRYELDDVRVTNTRTLEGNKERVTLRYGKCTLKEKKAG